MSTRGKCHCLTFGLWDWEAYFETWYTHGQCIDISYLLIGIRLLVLIHSVISSFSFSPIPKLNFLSHFSVKLRGLQNWILIFTWAMSWSNQAASTYCTTWSIEIDFRSVSYNRPGCSKFVVKVKLVSDRYNFLTVHYSLMKLHRWAQLIKMCVMGKKETISLLVF